MHIHRERLERNPGHTPIRYSRHDASRRDEAPQHRIVHPCVVIQQPRAVLALPGVILACRGDATTAHGAPGVEFLLAEQPAARVGRDTVIEPRWSLRISASLSALPAQGCVEDSLGRHCLYLVVHT